jgi:hypothetical protein
VIGHKIVELEIANRTVILRMIKTGRSATFVRYLFTMMDVKSLAHQRISQQQQVQNNQSDQIMSVYLLHGS